MPNAILKIIVRAGHETPITHRREINQLIAHFYKNNVYENNITKQSTDMA